jgi:ABC-type multidrug transport system fused ATPase/permease subunit
LQQLDEKPSSFHANRIKKDTESVMEFYEYTVSRLVSNVVTAVWVIVYAVLVNIWIAVVMVAVFFPLYLLIGKYYDRIRDRVFAARDQHSSVETFRYETIAGLRSLKLWLADKFRMKIYRKQYDDYIKNKVALSVSEYYPSLFQELFLEYLPTLAVFLAGGYSVLNGQITLGQWIALNLYSAQFVGPLSRVANIGGRLSIVEGTIERLQRYFSLESESSGSELKTPSSETITEIELDHVAYAYPNNTIALQDVSFKCTAGRVYAIVGSSGSGKSTIADMIAGLCSPQSGKYSINGISHTGLPINYIRSRTSIVSPSDFIFSDNIANNILIARPSASHDEMRAAARLAAADEFINETSNGYKTYVRDAGIGLSEGQIQRIVLARLFLKRGDVIVLDEATASVDPETEQIILRNVMTTFKGKIIIFITHHPSVAQIADEVIVLAEGSTIDVGTHQELSQRDKYYRALMDRSRRIAV